MTTKGQTWHCRETRVMDKNTRKYHNIAPAKTFEAKPHMMPGLTKEMLMGGRAPVARGGRS